MKKNNGLIIYMVKTDKGCFMSDCAVSEGYKYDYHNSKIKDLHFDGVNPKETFLKNWYVIDKYPTIIEVQEKDKVINERYVLKDAEMETKALPMEIPYDEMDDEYDDRYNLYELRYDVQKGELRVLDNVDIQVVCEVGNFELPPVINYKTTQEINFKDREIVITNVDIKHQMLNRLIIPEIMIHNYPCSVSSVQMYHIVRQHIKDNINNEYAKITSDYDFCFTVKKIVPLHTHGNYTYQNIFTRTKKERSKVHHGVAKYNEFEIFEMTHTGKNYSGYTPIQPITANSQQELKDKIDNYLEELMAYINEPLIECEHCKGMGYVNKIEKFELPG